VERLIGLLLDELQNGGVSSTAVSTSDVGENGCRLPLWPEPDATGFVPIRECAPLPLAGLALETALREYE